MVSIRDIENKTMNVEKRKEAKKDIFAFYIGRPLSYVLTIPFLKTNITPNQISLLSIIPLIIGTFIFCMTPNIYLLIIGWLCFFLWNLLDGVDGNIARYKEISSPMGSVVDAMAGYAAMFLSYLGMGVVAGNYDNTFLFQPKNYIVFGALSGVFVLFPRLVMHKAINTVKNEKSEHFKGRKNFGLKEMIALNITSITGFAQLFMLVAIVLKISDLFTIGYFIINLVIMILTIKKIIQ
ncbi:CDP-alcohol phosphatidyltransferase family protein [Gemella sanguinis]|uniref:CDP-alcohol phosphatidyltransferase family protein n=1 Tax=Gemella sanguinis TaxID=84135 RepID=UPI00352E35F6